MGRRTFSREFKLEAVKLVRDRGVAVAQACRDLEIAESVLRRWMWETIMLQTGVTTETRASFLRARQQIERDHLIHEWEPEGAAADV